MQFKTVLGWGVMAMVAVTVTDSAIAQPVPSSARNACIQRTAEEMTVATRDISVVSAGPVSAESGARTLFMRNNRTRQTAECRVNTIDGTVLSVNLGGSNNGGNSGGNSSGQNPEFWVVASKTFLKASPGVFSKTVTNNVPSGTVLRNLGCQRQILPTWCQVEFRDDPSVKGWAFTPNLREYTATPSTPPPNTSTSGRQGDPVPALQDLVGARGGQAENAVIERGYEWRNTKKQGDSSFSFWMEKNTGNCVAIRTTNGRYGAIVYTSDRDCNRR
jgi:hypothetical protein